MSLPGSGPESADVRQTVAEPPRARNRLIGRLQAARPRKVYYGWYIVVAALCAQMTAVAIQSHAQAVFLEPMTTDLGWSRTDFTWAQTLGTLVMSGGGFLVGSHLDTKGPRPFMLVGAVVMSASVVSLSQVDSIWQFLLLRGVGIALGAMMLGNLVANTTVSKWFVRRRAWAITISTTGLSISGAVTPRIVAALVDSFGWETSWMILGLGLLVLAIPAALVMRRRPEDYGLMPDGDTDEADIQATPGRRLVVTAATEEQWTRAEAIHTKTFWLLIVSFALASFSTGAFFLHFIAYVQDAGFSSQAGAARFSTALLATALSRPIWGAMMQRFAPRFCASFSFGLMSVCTAGIVLSLNTDSSLVLYLFLVGWGLGFGGRVPLQELIWATYYGRVNIGKVRGVALPLIAVATAIGPQFAARVYDAAGSYDSAFLAFAATAGIAAVVVIFARPPRRLQPVADDSG